MKYTDGLTHLDQLLDYIQIALSIRQSIQPTSSPHKVLQNGDREQCDNIKLDLNFEEADNDVSFDVKLEESDYGCNEIKQSNISSIPGKNENPFFLIFC